MASSEFLIIQEGEENLRIDRLLAQRFPEQSRTYFQGLIKDHLVLVNGEPVKKRETLKAGDEIEVEFALTPELTLEPENIPLAIIYEDDYLLVVNKPAGLVVHPAPGNWSHTFVNALLYYCKSLPHDHLRPGIVHRLDKNTSGLLVAAKTEECHKKLVSLFAARAVEKEYVAITKGKPPLGQIKTLLGRSPKDRQKMAVLEKGKEALTEILDVRTLGSYSLVSIKLLTGRTHQIRVHLAYVHAPIVGDALYGVAGADRQLLHAHKLSFTHPITHKHLSFEAPLPTDMVAFIKRFC